MLTEAKRRPQEGVNYVIERGYKLSCDDMTFIIMTVSCLRTKYLLLHGTFTHYKIHISKFLDPILKGYRGF